jgi:hypothetical protein
MIKQSGLIEIMSKEKAAEFVEKLDLLNESWVSRPQKGINTQNTFGGVSYLDTDPKQYSEEYTKLNPILLENFSELYEIIINKLTPLVGECRLAEELAYPGFQILGLKEKDPGVTSLIPGIGYNTELHIDWVSYEHKEYWGKFNNVEEDLLTVTVCLETHKNGSGLIFWDNQATIDSSSNYSNRVKDNASLNLKKLKMMRMYPFNKDKVDELDMEYPTIAEYFPGSMFYVIGNPWHQIAPAVDAMSNERRITLQAHALKCDGVWRLHF